MADKFVTPSIFSVVFFSVFVIADPDLLQDPAFSRCCLSSGPYKNCSQGFMVESRGGGYSHTLPVRVCAAQRGRDFEAPDLERGIHFRGVF